MKISEVLDCAFDKWYSDFKKITIRSKIIPIPNEVVEYLRSQESVILPKECDIVISNDEDSKWENDDKDGEEEEEDNRPGFPEFSSKIREAIHSLGGVVFCKLNWSAPRDATWIALGNNLRCSNLSDVYLLLKSSEFIRHDLTMPFKDCDDVQTCNKIPYILVLRKWTEINPAHEFRCFVKNKVIQGITQRDATNYFEHIAEDKSSIIRDIRSFFEEYIENKFPLTNFVFDIVRSAKDKVKLIDFNPYGYTTDSILFSWSELLEQFPNEDDPIPFRFVETNSGIQPNGLRHYSLPVDIIDLSTGADADKLVDFLKLQGDLNK